MEITNHMLDSITAGTARATNKLVHLKEEYNSTNFFAYFRKNSSWSISRRIL